MTENEKVDEEKALVAVAYKIEEPEVSNGVIKTRTNFEDFKGYLKKYLGVYESMQLTDENIEEVKLAKKNLRDTRIMIDKTVKEYIISHLNPALNLIDAQKKDALAYVEKLEGSIDELLEKYDQTRINALNAQYDLYWKEYRKEFDLPETFTKPLDKTFYAKGAMAKQPELKLQIKSFCLSERQAIDAHCKAVEVIKVTCGEEVDPSAYILLLDHMELADIIMRITTAIAQKKADAQKKAEGVEVPQVSSEDKNVKSVEDVWVASRHCDTTQKESISVSSEDETGIKTRTVVLTYRKEQGSLIEAFLVNNHIGFKFI